MEKKVEYVYHWNRIIVALAFLLVIIGISALVFFRWLSASPETTDLRDPKDVETSAHATTTPDDSPPPPAPRVAPPVVTASVESAGDTQVNTATPQSGAKSEAALPSFTRKPTDAAQQRKIADALEEQGAIVDPRTSEPRSSSDDGISNTQPARVVEADPTKASTNNDVVAAVVTERPHTPLAPTGEPSAVVVEQGLPAPTASDERAIAMQHQAPAPPILKPHIDVVEPSLQPPAIAADVVVKEQPNTPAISTTGPNRATVEKGLLPPTAVGTASDNRPKPDPSNGSEVPLRLGNITKHDASVKRFVLAKSVVRLEPEGELSDIRFDKRGMAAVYCFSEVTGREHPTIEYIWHRDDQVVARVNVAVKGKRWRSYSSKLINQSKQGNWRVELRGSNNELLASAEFVL